MSKVGIYSIALATAGLIWLGGCGPCFPPPTPDVCGPAGKPLVKKVVGYLPGPSKGCSTVSVEKSAPANVGVGQVFEYQLKVTNLTKAELLDVVLTDTLPDYFQAGKVTPAAAGTKDGVLTWKLGKLAPKASRLVKIEGKATQLGTLKDCTDVTYRMKPVCLTTDVIQPALSLTKTAPSQALVCDTIPVKLVVKNTGTGWACNVVVRDVLPKGLKTKDGKDVAEFKVGALKAGDSKELKVDLKAAQTGTYVNKATATGDAGLKVDSAPVTIAVVKPEVKVTKKAPTLRYIDRPIAYEITVTNSSKVPATNAVLTDHIPDGTSFVSATGGGRRSGGKVVWKLGDLAPGATKKVGLTLTALRPGVAHNTAELTVDCGEASAKASTTIKGIPAIMLEMVDDPDPVEVGTNTTYTITVTNQGSALDTNIRVQAVLPPEEKCVSSSGATKALVKGQVVTFAPLAVLAPKAKATFKVVVQGVKAGDVRFKVILKSDQMTTTAEETEATRIYE